jgi:hypothetical protein
VTPLKLSVGRDKIKKSKILSESFSWQKKITGYQGGIFFGKIDFDFLANFFPRISGG